MSEIVRDLVAEIKANRRKLESCPRHDFCIPVEPLAVWIKRWQCRNCGGEVENLHKMWYEKGLEHGIE